MAESSLSFKCYTAIAAVLWLVCLAKETWIECLCLADCLLAFMFQILRVRLHLCCANKHMFLLTQSVSLCSKGTQSRSSSTQGKLSALIHQVLWLSDQEFSQSFKKKKKEKNSKQNTRASFTKTNKQKQTGGNCWTSVFWEEQTRPDFFFTFFSERNLFFILRKTIQFSVWSNHHDLCFTPDLWLCFFCSRGGKFSFTLLFLLWFHVVCLMVENNNNNNQTKA